MIYVITELNCHEIVKKGETTSETVLGSKIFATKVLESMGYFPCDNASLNKGKWFKGTSNPHWVLRRKHKRYFINKEYHTVCVFLVPKHQEYALEGI